MAAKEVFEVWDHITAIAAAGFSISVATWVLRDKIYKFFKDRKKKKKVRLIMDIKNAIRDELIREIKEALVDALLEEVQNKISILEQEQRDYIDTVKEELESILSSDNSLTKQEINNIKEALKETVQTLKEYAVNKVGVNLTLAHIEDMSNEKIGRAQSDIAEIKLKIGSIEASILSPKINNRSK